MYPNLYAIPKNDGTRAVTSCWCEIVIVEIVVCT